MDIPAEDILVEDNLAEDIPAEDNPAEDNPAEEGNLVEGNPEEDKHRPTEGSLEVGTPQQHVDIQIDVLQVRVPYLKEILYHGTLHVHHACPYLPLP